MSRDRRSLPALLACAALAAGAAASRPAAVDAQDAETRAGLYDELEFRHIGPQGNRVIAVIGEPGNPNVYYVGAASGGVWKSTDGGHRWTPVFDDQPASSIGALALAPSDPNVVWAGTGETFIRANISIGNGIYRSTDGGESWEHRGLDAAGRIGRIVVHPRDPDIVLACALGHTYGPQEERGVFRTTDGGETWARVLFVDPDTGCSDLVMDPSNPRILFAGMWQIEVATWGRTSGGPGSSLWVSRDGGATWTGLEGSGLPTPPWGKIGLGMSEVDPDRVYALIETSSNRDFAPSDPYEGALWRSDDGGRSWRMVNASNDLSARWLYYTRVAVSPADADELYFNAPGHFTSLDGGETHFRTDETPGYDHHDMWIDPLDPDRMIVGHDGGVSISTTRGDTWHRPQLPIAQMYHAHVDDRIPYFVYGNRQDGPSVRAPSNTLAGGPIPIGEWDAVGGCEVGFAVPDTVDHRTVWTGCYDGILELHDLETGVTKDVSVWPVAVESWAAEDLEYRWQWTFPIEISPHDHETVYVGSQYVHRTRDRGQSWEVISPDLTSDDPELQRRMGGLTLDDAGPTIAPVVFAITESALEPGLLWAGSNDGLIHLTRDGGETWTDVTANLPGLPPRMTISSIQASRHAPGKAYVAVDGHQVGDFDPYLFVTEDYGGSWRRIDASIPRSVFSFTHVIREDPGQPGLLYAGTENGIWISFDDGTRWERLGTSLPPSPVHWIAVQERFADLVVATYGRGFWILDDLTPLRQLAARAGGGAEVRPAETVVFEPRAAYRFRSREAPMSQPDDPVAGENPEYGATLHYFLPAGLDGEAEIGILDAEGASVRTLTGPGGAGLHRVVWDLRSESTTQARLRTPPDENPWVEVPERGWRAMPDGGRLSILSPPGVYTVRLLAGSDTLSTRLEVLRDPGAPGSEAEIAEQLAVARALYDMLERAAGMINEIEALRVQLDGLEERLEDAEVESPDALVARADSVHAVLRGIEGRLFDLRHTGDGQDGLRWPRLLYARIGYLGRRVMSSDERPTDQQVAVYEMLRDELEALEARYESEGRGAVDALNRLLRERGVPHVIGGSAGLVP